MTTSKRVKEPVEVDVWMTVRGGPKGEYMHPVPWRHTPIEKVPDIGEHGKIEECKKMGFPNGFVVWRRLWLSIRAVKLICVTPEVYAELSAIRRELAA